MVIFAASSQGELWSWTLFFAGVTAVGFGSSYYHLNPNDATLVWDRLPVSFFSSLYLMFALCSMESHSSYLCLVLRSPIVSLCAMYQNHGNFGIEIMERPTVLDFTTH
jgi:hypothetical protein